MDTEGLGRREPTNEVRLAIFSLPFFLATKNHKSHKPDDLLIRTSKLFVDFVTSSG